MGEAVEELGREEGEREKGRHLICLIWKLNDRHRNRNSRTNRGDFLCACSCQIEFCKAKLKCRAEMGGVQSGVWESKNASPQQVQ